jgi:CheY-like chemotaxis protein
MIKDREDITPFRKEATMEKQRKILVIDPDPFERILCRVMLRGMEFVVPFCEDRESALERVSKETFDLILTNIMLPSKYLGLTLVQELHHMLPKTDIVVMADRSSIWDAREAVRLGAAGYLERPFTAECLMNVARKTFDRKGWIVRKSHIDQFRDYLAPSRVRENPAIYYKNGSWARHLKGDIWEVGYDTKYWSLSDSAKDGANSHLNGDLRRADNGTPSVFSFDQTLSIRLTKGLSALAAGEPYAHIRSESGTSYALAAPMTGTVREVNSEADDTMISRAPGGSGPDWMLWLARIQAREWDYGSLKGIEEGKQVGAYEHMA